MLKSIVNNIIPDNIKDIQLVKDAIDIFIDEITDKSAIAVDIYNLYSDKNEVIFEEIIKTFVNNVYKTIKNNLNNENLIKRLDNLYKKAGYSGFKDFRIDINLLEVLNKEVLESFKFFQQTKGHESSIEYMYNLVESLNFQQGILESDGSFNFYEGENPFEYYVEGSLIPELFEYFVKPIAHPVGWSYIYLRIYNLYFTDYFLSKPIYDISKFEIGCLNSKNNKVDNFLTNIGYLPFTNKKEKNIKPFKFYLAENKPVKDVIRFGNFFKELDLKSEINLVIDKEVINIEDYTNHKKRTMNIYFKSGERLEYINRPRSLKLYYFECENPLKARIKKDYDDFLGHCGLNIKYTKKVVTTIKDRIQFALDFGFSNTLGFLAAVGAGNFFLGKEKLGIKYLDKNVDLTYKSNIKNEVMNPSNYKNIYQNNYNEKHRSLHQIKFKDNKTFIYLNQYTFEDSKKPYKIILNDEVKEIDNFLIIFDKDIRDIKSNIKILDKNDDLHEEIIFTLKKIQEKSKFLRKFEIPDEENYIIENSYYYNNILGTLTLNDYDFTYYEKVKRIGNNGFFMIDDFKIEVINNDKNIELNFTDKIKMPKDFMPEINTKWYQTLWGMSSGHVDVYHNSQGLDDIWRIKDSLIIETINKSGPSNPDSGNSNNENSNNGNSNNENSNNGNSGNGKIENPKTEGFKEGHFFVLNPQTKEVYISNLNENEIYAKKHLILKPVIEVIDNIWQMGEISKRSYQYKDNYKMKTPEIIETFLNNYQIGSNIEIDKKIKDLDTAIAELYVIQYLFNIIGLPGFKLKIKEIDKNNFQIKYHMYDFNDPDEYYIPAPILPNDNATSWTGSPLRTTKDEHNLIGFKDNYIYIIPDTEYERNHIKDLDVPFEYNSGFTIFWSYDSASDLNQYLEEFNGIVFDKRPVFIPRYESLDHLEYFLGLRGKSDYHNDIRIYNTDDEIKMEKYNLVPVIQVSKILNLESQEDFFKLMNNSLEISPYRNIFHNENFNKVISENINKDKFIINNIYKYFKGLSYFIKDIIKMSYPDSGILITFENINEKIEFYSQNQKINVKTIEYKNNEILINSQKITIDNNITINGKRVHTYISELF